MARYKTKTFYEESMNIVVLGGGDSEEREVSLRSSRAVSNALIEDGFKVINLDPISPKSFDLIESGTTVFPILHGKNGEDGVVQYELERRNLPYLGSNQAVSQICFDKYQTRNALKQVGLPVAAGDKVLKSTYFDHPLVKMPHVLKVNKGGSSIGTYIIRDSNDISEDKVEELFKLCEEAVIEELVSGTEITVPILDNKALSIVEVIPPSGEDFDYINKYNGRTKEICPPTSINKSTQLLAKELAESAHAKLGCRHLSRVDIIVKPDNTMVVLEINTMPGMTDQSLYPLSAKTGGISFPELMLKFVDLVKRDYKL